MIFFVSFHFKAILSFYFLSFPIKWFFTHRYGFTFVFPLFFFFFVFLLSMTRFCCRLLRRIIVLSTVNFFVGLCIGNSDGKVQSNKVIRSNHVRQYAAAYLKY